MAPTHQSQASQNSTGADLRCCKEHHGGDLPGQVKVGDNQVPSILRLRELQQQGQALLSDGQHSGGQEGGQQRRPVGVRHEQTLVFLCKTRGPSDLGAPQWQWAQIRLRRPKAKLHLPHSFKRQENASEREVSSQAAGSATSASD